MIDLDDMEARIEAMERRLGDAPEGGPGLAPSVAAAAATLAELVGKKESTKAALAATAKLWETLDETGPCGTAEKLCVVRSRLPALEAQLAAMEAASAATAVLDSEHIRGAPALRPKLAHLRAQAEALRIEAASSRAEIGAVLAEYASVTALLSKQLAAWNHGLEKLES